MPDPAALDEPLACVAVTIAEPEEDDEEGAEPCPGLPPEPPPDGEEP